jgi:hypothetical protein
MYTFRSRNEKTRASKTTYFLFVLVLDDEAKKKDAGYIHEKSPGLSGSNQNFVF